MLKLSQRILLRQDILPLKIYIVYLRKKLLSYLFSLRIFLKIDILKHFQNDQHIFFGMLPNPCCICYSSVHYHYVSQKITPILLSMAKLLSIVSLYKSMSILFFLSLLNLIIIVFTIS